MKTTAVSTPETNVLAEVAFKKSRMFVNVPPAASEPVAATNVAEFEVQRTVEAHGDESPLATLRPPLSFEVTVKMAFSPTLYVALSRVAVPV